MRIATTLFALALLTAPVLAQSSTSEQPLQPGTWALQFRITDNFTLGSFRGSVLSAQYQRQEDRAVRVGVTLTSVGTELEIGNGEVTNSDTQFSLQGDYVLYLRTTDTVVPFWGLGPGLGFALEEGGGGEERTSFSLQGRAFVGAEWFVAPPISLTAEYALTADHAWQTTEEEGVLARERDSRRWSVRGGVLFGVTVRF
ncbi:MAG: hypothetical protein AAGI71_19570 [Bacteroidota bacterium]